MPTFTITAPDGKRYKVTGATKEGALAALKSKLEGPQQPTQLQQQPQAQPQVQPQQQQAAAPKDTSMGSAFKVADAQSQGASMSGTASLQRNLSQGPFGQFLQSATDNYINPIREGLGFEPIDRAQVDADASARLQAGADRANAEAEKIAEDLDFYNMTTSDINSVGDFVNFIGQKTAQAAPYMGAALASGGTLTYPFAVGEISQNLSEIEGLPQDKADDIAAAGGAISAALETLGIAKLLPKGASNSILGGIANGVITEGTTEGLQELVNIGSEAVGGKQFSEGEILNRLKEAAAAGSVAGGAFKGSTQAASKAKSLFTSDGKLDVNNLDNSTKLAAGDVARELQQIATAEGFKLSNVDVTAQFGAKGALEAVREQNNGEITELVKALKGKLNSKNASSLDQVLSDFAPANAGIKSGKNKVSGYVSKTQMAALARLVGPYREGAALMNALAKSNVITGLFKDGMKGGISQFTDYFSPFGTSGAVYDPTRIGNIIVGGGAAAATMGQSVPIQAGIVGLGRLVDAVTGRRNKLSRFVNKNINAQGLPSPSGVSLVDKAKAAESDAKVRREALARIATQIDAPPNANSPVGTILSGTGLSRDGLSQTINSMAQDFAGQPELAPVLKSIQQNMDGDTNPVLELNEIIPIIGQYAQMTAPELIVATPDNPLLARGVQQSPAQTQAQTAAPSQPRSESSINADFDALAIEKKQLEAQASSIQDEISNLSLDEAQARKQEFAARMAPIQQRLADISSQMDSLGAENQARRSGNQFTTPENYQAGKSDNNSFARSLASQVSEDAGVSVSDKAQLLTALEDVQSSLGPDPVAALDEITTELQNIGVNRDVIDTYFKPYRDRVALQQARVGRMQAPSDQSPAGPTVDQSNAQDPDEPTVASINPDIPLPTTVQTAALSTPTPVVHQQIDAPAGKTNHGLLPHLRTETKSFREGKPLFVLKTTNKNAQRQIESIDEVLNRHPDPASSSEAWGSMLGDAYASKDIPVQPNGFIEDLNNGGAQKLLSQLTPGQIADADHGFRNAAEFRSAYTNGEIGVEDTGRLFLWSFLSKGVSPYNQEALFIDAFDGIDKWITQAAEGSLNLDEYKKWAATTAPQGSGKPGAGAIHNLNAFGRDFLLKMSQDAGKGDGRSRLKVIHDMMSDPNTTGKDVRREFMRLGEGVGIDNKVVSFTLLVSGYPDVLVLDRVQMRQMWNDGRFSGINLYDGYKHNGNVVNGSGMALTTTGARGLLVYEAMEKSLQNRLQQIYSEVGRPDDASIGRYHWETWVASSQQEASHGTIDAVLARAKGDPNPLEGVTAKEGEYGAYAYGARYGIENGVPMFTYGVPERGDYKFTVPEFQSFLNDIKRKAKSNKVIPYGFGIQESGNAPWYTREGVNLDALAEKAKEYGTQIRGTDAELREGQTIPDGRTPDAVSGEPAVLSRALERAGSADGIRKDEQGQTGRPKGVGALALQGATEEPQVVTSLNGLNEPDVLNDFLARPGWAIITATNENLPDSIRDTRNAENNAYLEQQLNKQGIPFITVSGAYQGIDQGPSFLILADEETAMKLGKFHLQESILTNQGLVYTRRPAATTPATRKNMFGPQAQQQDFYSTVSGLPFSMGLDFDIGPTKQFYKPGYTEAPNRPQLPMRERDGMVELHHWSDKRRKTIDPHFAGSGPLNGVERKRAAKISFFGIAPRQSLRDPGTGYVKEAGLGSFEHVALIDPKDLYPVFQDPDGLLKGVGSNWSKAEDIIKDAGYKGYYTTDDGSGSAPLGNVATLFESIKVSEVTGELVAESKSPIAQLIGGSTRGASNTGPRLPIIPRQKPEVTADHYKRVSQSIRPAFEVGKEGSEFEDGVPDFEAAVDVARKMGIVVKLASSQKEMTVTNSLDTNKPITPNLSGAYQRVGAKKRGKGYEGTIWAMRPGSTKADGSTVSNIEALTTLLHEISHAITMGPLDGKADQEIVSYFINRQQSSKPETNIAGRSDFSVPGSFVDSAIRPLLENDYNQMTPKQQRIYSEIVNLQETVDAYSPKNPNERRAVRFIRRAYEIGMSPEGVQTYKDYTRMAVEFAVDPVWVYLINPKLAKKLMPLTSKLIQSEFRKAGGKTIQFYAHPLAVVIAAFAALELARDEEEERQKQQQMAPGALTPPPGALTAA